MSDYPKPPDYDSLMIFLAETPECELISLSQQPSELAQRLKDEYPSRPWGNLAPDSQEAQDAATADGERTDDAEETIRDVLIADPAAWEAILMVMEAVADPAATAFFRRYQKPLQMDEGSEAE